MFEMYIDYKNFTKCALYEKIFKVKYLFHCLVDERNYYLDMFSFIFNYVSIMLLKI